MENKLREDSLRTGGFTLIELIIVIGVLAILTAAALPQFIQWQQGLRYKEASKGLVAALRAARSSAITTNRQVELEISGNTYRTRPGNKAMASAVWDDTPWVRVPSGVGLNSPNSRIIANPNGTLFFSNTSADPVFFSVSPTMTASVQNISVSPAVNRYGVALSQTGRISVSHSN